ncbi:exosome complex exonuclease RRP44-like [Mercenaria mercenaria]|uniref:exosome complex exonuclease RRP44-like n=1 Tax=Mercenaria mercenaria TaxID=6596 RepID=UPI00234E443D|nr:exosome complex exonuclease RRP44-like [Mercenaria mercenaria]
MLTNKVFLKKTKKGSILKIVREHYLRDDIACGSACCDICVHDEKGPVLEDNPGNPSQQFSEEHYIIPDTNVVLHQIDVLEDTALQNVIILQTVVEEVRHRSAPAYKRLKEVLANPGKHFYSFANEFNKETYIEREPGEKSNDRNDRAIREAAIWYRDHLSKQNCSVKIVLITNDADNRAKAKQSGLVAFTDFDIS